MSVHCVEADSEWVAAFEGVAYLLSGLSAVSVAGWMKPTTLVGNSVLLNAWTQGDTSTQRNQVLFRGNGTELQCYVYTGGSSGGNVGKTLSTGVWQHVGLTYDGSTLIGYLNGLPGGTTYSPSGVIATDNPGLALSGYSSTYYDGLAEDRAIWNRALSADEMYSMYSARLRAGFFRDGLIQWWPLDVPGDGVYNAFVNGNYGGRDLAGAYPAFLGTAPDWSTDSPGLHWPSPVQATPYVAPAGGVIPYPYPRGLRAGYGELVGGMH